jgi:hypothetical protein
MNNGKARLTEVRLVIGSPQGKFEAEQHSLLRLQGLGHVPLDSPRRRLREGRLCPLLLRAD